MISSPKHTFIVRFAGFTTFPLIYIQVSIHINTHGVGVFERFWAGRRCTGGGLVNNTNNASIAVGLPAICPAIDWR